METFLIGVLFFIFGLIFGSFFNVVAYRLPNNMSIIYPQSHCPNCNHKLSPFDLIPIISYFIQKGKCRYCNKKIEIFYPLFELLSGIMFLLSYLIFDFSPMLYISLIFSSALLIIILSDIKYMIIPDEVIIYSSILLVIIRLIFYGFGDLINILIDSMTPFIVMYLLKRLGNLLFNKESLGDGDIKLMIIFGLAIGFEMSIFSIFVASFIALPISLYMLIRHKKNILPFGPYLSIAALIILFTQIKIDTIIDWLI